MKDVGAIAAIFGVVVVVVAALFVVTRSKQLTETMKGLREEATTWKGNAEAEKSRGDRLEAEVTRLTTRVEKLEQEREQLIEIAHGAPELRSLIAALKSAVDKSDERHMENLAYLSRLEGGISRMETHLLKPGQ